MEALSCRHCGDETGETTISFSITAAEGTLPILHFHPQCFLEIAGDEYLEEMFEIAKYRAEKIAERERRGRHR